MQPDNPNVGGTVLRRPAIQSPNYVAGSTGWTINADGSAEFNNAAIRGELDVGTSPNARFVFGGPIPTVLATWGAANNVTFSEVTLFYWNATDFVWQATGTFVAQNCVFRGTYDTTNGVYVLERILDTGAGAIETRYGSYALNGFQETWTTQQIKVQIGDGSNIGDQLNVNGPLLIFGTEQGRGIRASASATTNSAAASVEAVILTTGTMNFQNGRAYRVEVGGGLLGSVADNHAVFGLRKNNLAGTSVFSWNRTRTLQSAGLINPVTLWAFLSNTTGADITGTALALTLIANTGTVTHVGAALMPRFVRVLDEGLASDNPQAAPIT
jgi:hypothetical protein